MPLTFDDREDLHIKIACLRSEILRLEKERSELVKERDSLLAQLRSASILSAELDETFREVNGDL